jgi:hypothetical protein
LTGVATQTWDVLLVEGKAEKRIQPTMIATEAIWHSVAITR